MLRAEYLYNKTLLLHTFYKSFVIFFIYGTCLNGRLMLTLKGQESIILAVVGLNEITHMGPSSRGLIYFCGPFILDISINEPMSVEYDKRNQPSIQSYIFRTHFI